MTITEEEIIEDSKRKGITQEKVIAFSMTMTSVSNMVMYSLAKAAAKGNGVTASHVRTYMEYILKDKPRMTPKIKRINGFIVAWCLQNQEESKSIAEKWRGLQELAAQKNV